MENEILDKGFENIDNKPLHFASFWDRTLAIIIDSLVLLIPVTAVMFYGLYSKSLTLVLVASVTSILYKVVMEGMYGATLGKMARGIIMISRDRYQIDIQQSIKKNMIYVISNVIGMLSMFSLFSNEGFLTAKSYLDSMQYMNSTPFSTYGSLWSLLILISCMTVLFNTKTKQTLHDMIADTYCVKTKS